MACFVVKVEFGGALRRMNLDGAGDHEFTVNHIRNRARELFKISADTETEFSYIDAEGDIVALADDHDVDDALFQQGLNPLRIIMVTKTSATDDWIAITNSRSSKSDFFERAVSVADNANAIDQLPSTLDDVLTSVTPEFSTSTPNPAQFREIEAIVADEWETWKASTADAPAPAEKGSPSALSNTEAARRTSPSYSHSHHGEEEEEEEEELEGEDDSSSVKNVADAENAVPTVTITPPTEGEADDIHWGVQCDGCLLLPIKGPRFRSCKKSNFDLCLRCFASKVYDGNVLHTDFVRLTRRFHRIGDPANSGNMSLRSFKLRHFLTALLQASKNEASTVAAPQCDECGVTPIEGPRFKSRTRFNYDLCHGCFVRSGSDDKEFSRTVVVDHRSSVSAVPSVPVPLPVGVGAVNFGTIFPTVRKTWTKMINLAEGQYQQMGSFCERLIADINAWKFISYETVKNDEISSPVPIIDVEAAAKATADLQADGSKKSRGGVTDGASVQSDANTDALKIIDTKGKEVIDAKGESASSSSSAAVALPAVEESALRELLVKLRDMGFTDEALNKEVLEKNGLSFVSEWFSE